MRTAVQSKKQNKTKTSPNPTESEKTCCSRHNFAHWKHQWLQMVTQHKRQTWAFKAAEKGWVWPTQYNKHHPTSGFEHYIQ